MSSKLSEAERPETTELPIPVQREERNPAYRLGFWLIGLLALAIAVYLLLTKTGGRGAAVASQSGQRPPVPVAAIAAKRGDLSRYITAIGSVSAFNTVTVKSRVDGQIVRVDFKEGQLVQRGDLLIEIDPRPYKVQLAQAEGQMARDRASLINARVTLARDRMLYANNVIARQDLDNQESSVGQYQGAIVSDQAAIDSAKLQLTYCRITAPITGRIGLRLVDVGNVIHATDTTGLAVITQLQPIAVTFSIPEDDLPRVVRDMRNGEELPVDAYDRDMKMKLGTGTLETFDSQIDQTTGTIKLKAIFPNPDYSLFPNQFVNARLLVDTIRDAVLIPAAAVQKNPQGDFVYVVGRNNIVNARKAAVSATQGDIVALASGVTAGEFVVVDGLDKLQPGARVSIQPEANPAPRGNSQ